MKGYTALRCALTRLVRIWRIDWPGRIIAPRWVTPVAVAEDPSAAPRPQESGGGIYYGWWMVAITSVMSFFASGVFFRGFGVLVLPIRDQLGITQAQTNLIFSIARAEGGLEGPVAGWLIDKWGNRAVLVPSLLIAVAGYAVMAFWLPGFWGFALIYLGLVSLGNSMAFQHACFAGLNQWFHRRRSLAISILAAVSSLGGLALIPTMNLLIDKSGLRWGLIASGGFYAVFLLPLCFWFRNKPEDMGLLPDGASRPPVARGGRAGAAQRETRDYTTKEALRTQAYWLLMLGAGLRQTATLGILVSLFPILVEDKGMSTQMAANLIGVMSFINFVSRLALGYMGDRVSKKWIMFFSLTVEGIGYLFLWLGDWQTAIGITLVLGFILFEGMMDGAGVIVWAALGEYFGRDRFATLRGYITFAYAWALVASPVYAGWVADRFGNYDYAVVPGAICAFAAGACFLFIKPPPELLADVTPTADD